MNQASFSFSKQPKGLGVLFFSEVWERFSFYGMRGLLALYMIKVLMYPEADAYGVYGAYGTLVYAGPVIGGYLADKFLGYKNSIILGGVLMAIGHFAMAFPSEFMFYNALALIAIGNGFFKPNISSTVGLLYEENDPRRDVGFTIFYMGVNLGGFGQLLCAYLGANINWHLGFSCAGVGMVIGLLVFMLNKKVLGTKGDAPDKALLNSNWIGPISRLHVLCIAPFLFIPAYVYLLQHHHYLNNLLSLIALAALSYFLYQAFTRDKIERERIFVILILMVFSTLFWSFFEQAGSSLNVFADKNIDKVVWGFEIPAPVFQSVNSFFIITCAPLFSMLWAWLSRRGLDPSVPVKFAIGILLLGLGFYILSWGEAYADSNAMVPLIFLILGYFFHTAGELCNSPVGLSMVSRLAPKDLAGILMGTWMLSWSFAHSLGALVSQLTASPAAKAGDELNAHLVSLKIYTDVFATVGLTAVIAAVVLLLISPLLKKWMHEGTK